MQSRYSQAGVAALTLLLAAWGAVKNDPMAVVVVLACGAVGFIHVRAVLTEGPKITIGTITTDVPHGMFSRHLLVPVTVSNNGAPTGFMNDWTLSAESGKGGGFPLVIINPQGYDKATFCRKMQTGFIDTAILCFEFASVEERDRAMKDNRLILTVTDSNRKTFRTILPN